MEKPEMSGWPWADKVGWLLECINHGSGTDQFIRSMIATVEGSLPGAMLCIRSEERLEDQVRLTIRNNQVVAEEVQSN